MIDEIDVQKYRDKYKFKIRTLNDITILVDSGMDEWIINIYPKVHSDHKHIELRHKNYKYDRGHYHLQSKHLDLDSVFKSIYNHENRFFYIGREYIKLNSLYRKIHT